MANNEKVEALRQEILSRAAKESKPLIKKIENIKGRIAQLEGRVQETGQKAEGLKAKIGQLRDKALFALKGGDDPLPELRKMADSERDLEALSTLPGLNAEALESLQEELDQTRGRLHQVLAHAAAEIRTEQSQAWTEELSGLVNDLEDWKAAVEGVSLCGIMPHYNPTAKPGFGHNDRLLRLECLNPGVSRELGWLFR